MGIFEKYRDESDDGGFRECYFKKIMDLQRYRFNY